MAAYELDRQFRMRCWAHGRRRWRRWFGLAVALLCVSAQGCTRQSEPPIAADAPPVSASTLSLRDVNLGVIARAGQREIVVRLVNPTDSPLRWSKLRTSCKCLSVTASKNEIDPPEDVLAAVRLDAGEQAGFVGNLSVEVTAAVADGTDAFRFNVLAQIVPENELAFCAEGTQ